MGENNESYPKRDPENFSVFLIYDIVASKIILFLFALKRESPYKSMSLLILSKRLKIIGNRIYTIYKIKTIMKKIMAVRR